MTPRTNARADAIETGDTVRFLKTTRNAHGHVRYPGDKARVTNSWEHGRVIDVEWGDGEDRCFLCDIARVGGAFEKVYR
jgi:hypothetical protein